MNSAGYLFLIAAVFVLRQVAVGRATSIPTDARDLFTSLINFDFEGVGTVLAGRGENVSVGSPESGSLAGEPTDTPSTNPIVNAAFAAKVIGLGSAAKGYRLGAIGPDYYDCSGLTWQAGRALGIYTGARYTTSTFKQIAGSWAAPVDKPGVGDLILWPGHHIGVCVGPNTMYSARSSTASPNIGKSTISGDAQYFGSQPEYWRIKDA